MSAITRMGKAVALLALLAQLALPFGATARAGAPGRPIDSAGGPPDPVQVGDPDAGHNGLWEYLRQSISAMKIGPPHLRDFAKHFARESGPRTRTAARKVSRR